MVVGPDEVWDVSSGVADVIPGDDGASWEAVLGWAEELEVTTVTLVTKLVVETSVVGSFVVG